MRVCQRYCNYNGLGQSLLSAAMPTSPSMRNKLSARRIYWALLLVWGLASVAIADRLAETMKFRINDLSVIPGAGMIMRDPEGTFFHVNSASKARAIYPELEASYHRECLDCSLVTGEQMSQTNDFCAAGVKSKLPKIDFELPCQSWAVMGDGTKVVAITLFLVPVLLWPMLRALARAIIKN
jgi:hypothetical protein